MNREKVPNKLQSLTILTCGWFLKYWWQENFQHVLRIHWGNVLEPSSHLPALLYLTLSLVLLRRQGRLRGRVSYYNREWKSDLPSHSPSLSLECSLQTMYSSTSLWLLLHSFRTRLSDPTPWTAHLGMYVQGNAKFVSPVRRIVVHEYYNSQTFDYDIALLQLSVAWPETLKQLIQPICIPPAGQKVRSGEKCWVTGWGRRHEAGVCASECPLLPSRPHQLLLMWCFGVHGEGFHIWSHLSLLTTLIDRLEESLRIPILWCFPLIPQRRENLFLREGLWARQDRIVQALCNLGGVCYVFCYRRTFPPYF